MDNKAITTPMASNLKILSDASLEAVDGRCYDVSLDDWVLDVRNEHETRYLL